MVIWRRMIERVDVDDVTGGVGLACVGIGVGIARTWADPLIVVGAVLVVMTVASAVLKVWLAAHGRRPS